MTQAWGKVKEKEWYQGCPLSELCCVSEAPTQPPVTETDKVFFRKTLMEACPDSALSLHARRKRKTLSTPQQTQRVDDSASRVVMRTCEPLYNRAEALTDQFYLDVISLSYEDSVKLCREPQGSAEWKQARRVRITASECYTLYTAQSGFKDKFARITSGKFKGCAATSYGSEMESRARALYESVRCKKVQQCGLVVPPMMPWVGCSPDGIVEEDGGLVLLELKCPALCKDESLVSVLQRNRLPYLRLEGENLTLKKKHKYYAQVQLTLAILDLDVCDFCVYDGSEDEVHIIQVKRDRAFCCALVQKLGEVYFSHILPHLKRYAP